MSSSSLPSARRESGYIDAYYGPEDLQSAGKAIGQAESLPQLAARVSTLQGRVSALGTSPTPESARRARFLTAQLTAAATRLRMLQGEKLRFEEEALGLFRSAPS